MKFKNTVHWQIWEKGNQFLMIKEFLIIKIYEKLQSWINEQFGAKSNLKKKWTLLYFIRKYYKLIENRNKTIYGQ